MKRSEINQILREFCELLNKYNFKLPSFAHYNVADWRQQSKDVIQRVHHYGLGWDVTDFNKGDFHNLGLSLFTVRNGEVNGSPCYAEKLMHVRINQITPMHYHVHKTEDIINRNGGQLVIRFFGSKSPTMLDKISPITIYQDEQKILLNPGETITLNPGQSVQIPPYLFHSFWAQNEEVLAGEVSMANDDVTDNLFLESLGRFSDIIEDEPVQKVLCNEYNHWLAN